MRLVLSHRRGTNATADALGLSWLVFGRNSTSGTKKVGFVQIGLCGLLMPNIAHFVL
jgi:hypothetical protein